MLYLYCSLLASRQKTKTNRAIHNSAYTGLRTKESREATQSLAEALKTRLMTPSKSEGRTQGFYSNVVSLPQGERNLNRGLGAYVLSVTRFCGGLGLYAPFSFSGFLVRCA